MVPNDNPWTEEKYVSYLEGSRHMFAWCLVTYGETSWPDAIAEAVKFYRYEPPDKPYRGLAFHDESWHWAMLKLHGERYWKSHPELEKASAEYREESRRHF
jgi:hypothetical protein